MNKKYKRFLSKICIFNKIICNNVYEENLGKLPNIKRTLPKFELAELEYIDLNVAQFVANSVKNL